MSQPQSSWQALGRLLRYARGYRRRIAAASVCSIINKLFDIAPEILIGIAIDVVVNQEESFVAALGFVDARAQILLLGVLTFLIWAGESLFEYLYLILWRNLAQRLQADLRQDAYEHLQRQDMAFFENRSSGDLVAVLNDDVNQLERFLDGGANELIQVLVTVVAVGAVFFALAPLIAVLAFMPIPLIIWGAFFFQRRAAPLYTGVRERVGRLAERLANNINGMATIKSFTAEDREAQRLREAIGLVSQEVFLFEGSIRDNIAYGRPNADLAAVERAARQAEAWPFIASLPDGLQTTVGERGVRLSGGQRQRIALARALLKDPPILVLDEATSAVDNETEAAIQRSLARISHGRTVLVIAHRLSTVVGADQIAVLDGGRVVEQGSHEALLRRGGHYAAQWRVQTGAAPAA